MTLRARRVLKRIYWEIRANGIGELVTRLLEDRRKRRSYRRWVEEESTLSDPDRDSIRAHLRQFHQPMLISIVMPVYNTPARWLTGAIESVLAQVYPHWELCIADDCSTEPHVRSILERYAARDARIKIVYRERNGHIAAASNSALELASGAFVAFLDHDDELAEEALYMIAAELELHPKAALVYSDEDKMDERGRRFDPHFKPDWNPEMALAQNYVCHFAAYRRSVVAAAGGLRPGYEGSQDHDLLLRCMPAFHAGAVRHVARILYHWRAIRGSTALSLESKHYAVDASLRALRDHLGATADVSAHPPDSTIYRVAYRAPTLPPRVAIVIPTRDRLQLISQCVDSIRLHTRYPNYEIVIVDNGSRDVATRRYLTDLRHSEDATVLDYDHPFNYSAINNFAASRTDAPILCFLNDDTTVITPEWLDEMVAQVSRAGVGIVGAKLLYPDGRIQHAGIRLGLPGIGFHSHRGYGRHSGGYWGRLLHAQDVSAVTGACLVIARSVFDRVGGFDADNLPIGYSDVDLCLKVREAGLRVIWTPHAELWHHESASRGSDQEGANRARLERESSYMKRRWGSTLASDRFYNPNLAMEREDFELARPSRAVKPWLAASHAAR